MRDVWCPADQDHARKTGYMYFEFSEMSVKRHMHEEALTEDPAVFLHA